MEVSKTTEILRGYFKLVPAKGFFETYAPGVKNYYHKMRGIDGNGKPIEFTRADRDAINTGVRALSKDLRRFKI